MKATGGGNYNVTVTKQGKIKVNVTATMEDGEKRNMGAMEFRVKPLPKPIVQVGTLTGSGLMNKNLLAMQSLMRGGYDPSFEFEATPTVKSFKMFAIVHGVEVSADSDGNKFSKNQLDIIKSLRGGQKVHFEEIKVMGPDLITHTLDMTVTLTN